MPNGVACPSDFVGSAGDFPRYWEFAALHDLVHTFGIVSPSAPHHTETYPGHVPEPNDLMHTGPSNWVLDFTTTVDVGGDDYLGTAVPEGVRRLDSSPFVIPDDTRPPALIPPGRAALEVLAKQAAGLPIHPPFPGG